MSTHQALLVVDVQNDFCPGGALAVPEGDRIIPSVNDYINLFASREAAIFVSRDWHPRKTSHFREFGGIWPVHCVQGSEGAKFHPRLQLPQEAVIISKGMDPDKDSYSAFQGQDAHGNGLLSLLNQKGIEELYVCGLAMDYCVKHSVLDALDHVTTYVLQDAVKGVNLKPDDTAKAVTEVMDKGAIVITIKDIMD